MMTQTSPENSAPLPRLLEVAAALGAAGQPQPSLAALDTALAQLVGHKLFTVLVLNFAKNENQRYYSNQPKAYPTGGAKPIEKESELYKEVVLGGRARICHDAQDIRRAFFDHELIASLGCESCINVPVRWNGRTLGTMNLLHEAHWYREDHAPMLQAFAALAVPAMLEIIRRW